MITLTKLWCTVGARHAPAGRRSWKRPPTCGLRPALRRSGTRWRHGSGRRAQPTSCRCSSSPASIRYTSTCSTCPPRLVSSAGARASLPTPRPSPTHWGSSGTASSTPELWRLTTPLGTISLWILETFCQTTTWNRALPTLTQWWVTLTNLQMVSSKEYVNG